MAVAGAASYNLVEDQVEAYLADSASVIAGSGGVSVTANDGTTITSSGGGGAIGVAGSGGVAVAGAVGFSVVFNEVKNTVYANVTDSTVQSASLVDVLATEGTTIMSLSVVGGAVAATVATGASVSAAVAVGTCNANVVKSDVEAWVFGSTITTTASGNVQVTATDTPNVSAENVGATLAFAAGLSASVTFSIAATAGQNSVTDTVFADVVGLDDHRGRAA